MAKGKKGKKPKKRTGISLNTPCDGCDLKMAKPHPEGGNACKTCRPLRGHMWAGAKAEEIKLRALEEAYRKGEIDEHGNPIGDGGTPQG